MFGVYAFSEEALSSDSLNPFVELSGVSATAEVGNISIGFGATVALDEALATATMQVGNVSISISARFDVSGVFARGEVGDVLVYGLERNDDDSNYYPIIPSPDSNYGNLVPSPGSTWNDLVT